MAGRRNALLGLARVAQAVDDIAHEHAPLARGTVGSQVAVGPGSRNVIPGRVDFTVDLRHPAADTLDAMDAALRQVCAETAADIGLLLALEQISYTEPVAFDPDCVAAVKRACERLGVSHTYVTSGAGHDACYVARRAPTAMLFAPCKDGVSHHESESAEPEDLEAVCNVLLHAVLGCRGHGLTRLRREHHLTAAGNTSAGFLAVALVSRHPGIGAHSRHGIEEEDSTLPLEANLAASRGVHAPCAKSSLRLALILRSGCR